MNELKEVISRWSLDRVRFLLSHIEDFVDDEQKEWREKARGFSAETGLEKIENLAEGDPSEPGRPLRVLERVTPFFESGLLVQRSPAADSENWWVTDLFSRGIVFHLELKDQASANHLMPQIPPIQIQRAPAMKTLEALHLNFLCEDPEADAYILKPTPSVAYILISRLPGPWSVDHMAHTQRLVNKAFVF